MTDTSPSPAARALEAVKVLREIAHEVVLGDRAECRSQADIDDLDDAVLALDSALPALTEALECGEREEKSDMTNQMDKKDLNDE